MKVSVHVESIVQDYDMPNIAQTAKKMQRIEYEVKPLLREFQSC